MDYMRYFDSPLGRILLGSDGTFLTGLWFDGQEHYASTLGPVRKEAALPVFSEAECWLDLYFSGRNPGFTPALALHGTPFRKAVWEILLSVPYGKTVTYSGLTELLSLPRASARAVGGAVAHNPVSLVVPCHRVVGAGGSLTGYAGGLSRKAKLLEMERAYAQYTENMK